MFTSRAYNIVYVSVRMTKIKKIAGVSRDSSAKSIQTRVAKIKDKVHSIF